MAGPDSQGYTCWDVATKQPKVPQDANIKLSHANPEVEKHLHHLFLELLALTHTDLRNHPNIASLIAWSYDAHAFHSPLILVMALADYNLAAYLKAGGVEVSLASKYCICQDIAAGLDALHGCKLVHGDLKPENVLLYKQRGRLLAKLADFGLLVSEPVSKPTDLRLGGTLGWQAPEVEEGRILNLDELPRTDSYSLGLVIWSSLLYGGKAPPKQEGVTRQALAMKDIETSRHDIGLKYDSCLPGIISELLQENQKRPKDLEKLFEVATSSEEHW
jgi:serine/threonine protein kinase